MLRATMLSIFCPLCLASSALAHFVWLDAALPESGPAQVRAYFGELPEPGELHLVGKIAAAKAWARDADGRITDLALTAPSDKELAMLVADCDRDSAASLEALCDYGIYQRGVAAIRLYYYAKHLPDNWGAPSSPLGRAERLRLDIVPSRVGDKLVLQVLFDGKPDPGREVVVHGPDGTPQQLKTDDQGRAELPLVAGRHAIRAGHVEPDEHGKLGDKAYEQVWHYATLTLSVPQSAPNDLDAKELLQRARAGRSTWNSFPGLSADVTVTVESQQAKGKLNIERDGTVTLEMPDSPLKDWASDQINSLVQHRMPDGEVAEGNVALVEGDQNHPLGRQIDLGDAGSKSCYRIQDDVIREVCRNAGRQRFTISVLEIVRNAENKYLPRSFTMTFFDAASGELQTSLGYWNEWQRVGNFDVPRTILETSTEKGNVATRQLVFENCHLPDDK